MQEKAAVTSSACGCRFRAQLIISNIYLKIHNTLSGLSIQIDQLSNIETKTITLTLSS